MNILKRLAQQVWRLGLVWLAALLLLWWAFKDVPWTEVIATLQRLKAGQVLILVAINGLVLATFSLRLGILLRAKGYSISLITLTRYWLVGFAVSYFTPGPQLGGGPFQIYLLYRRRLVPLAQAVAAVVVSKILERVGNAMFLLFGIFFLLHRHFFPQATRNLVVIIALILLVLPAGYLAAVWQGLRPISYLFSLLPVRLRVGKRMQKVFSTISTSEEQIISFCRHQPSLLFVGLGLTLLSWVIIVAETWLILFFLGARFTLVEAIAMTTIAQLAFLLPTPAGLGTLEAGLVAVFHRLDYPVATGISLALIIRARDILLGGLGLVLGSEIIFKRQTKSIISAVSLLEQQKMDSSPKVAEKLLKEPANESE